MDSEIGFLVCLGKGKGIMRLGEMGILRTLAG